MSADIFKPLSYRHWLCRSDRQILSKPPLRLWATDETHAAEIYKAIQGLEGIGIDPFIAEELPDDALLGNPYRQCTVIGNCRWPTYAASEEDAKFNFQALIGSESHQDGIPVTEITMEWSAPSALRYPIRPPSLLVCQSCSAKTVGYDWDVYSKGHRCQKCQHTFRLPRALTLWELARWCDIHAYDLRPSEITAGQEAQIRLVHKLTFQSASDLSDDFTTEFLEQIDPEKAIATSSLGNTAYLAVRKVLDKACEQLQKKGIEFYNIGSKVGDWENDPIATAISLARRESENLLRDYAWWLDHGVMRYLDSWNDDAKVLHKDGMKRPCKQIFWVERRAEFLNAELQTYKALWLNGLPRLEIELEKLGLSHKEARERTTENPGNDRCYGLTLREVLQWSPAEAMTTPLSEVQRQDLRKGVTGNHEGYDAISIKQTINKMSECIQFLERYSTRRIAYYSNHAPKAQAMGSEVQSRLPKLNKLALRLGDMANQLRVHPTPIIVDELYREYDAAVLEAECEASDVGLPRRDSIAFFVSDPLGNPMRQSFAHAIEGEWDVTADQLKRVADSVCKFATKHGNHIIQRPNAQASLVHLLRARLNSVFDALCRLNDADEAKDPFRDTTLIMHLHELVITRATEAREAAGVYWLLPLLERVKWPNADVWFHSIHSDLTLDHDLVHERGKSKLRHSLGELQHNLHKLEAMISAEPAASSINGRQNLASSCLNSPVDVFIAYSHQDNSLRQTLVTHLGQLKNDGLIREWHDRKITAGSDWQENIDEHLEKAQIILLLISADFLDSKYCYGIETKRAMERHAAKTAIVIPVILRECDWHSAPFSKLEAVPEKGKPVMEWENTDKAFTGIAKELRKIITGAFHA